MSAHSATNGFVPRLSKAGLSSTTACRSSKGVAKGSRVSRRRPVGGGERWWFVYAGGEAGYAGNWRLGAGGEGIGRAKLWCSGTAKGASGSEVKVVGAGVLLRDLERRVGRRGGEMVGIQVGLRGETDHAEAGTAPSMLVLSSSLMDPSVVVMVS